MVSERRRVSPLDAATLFLSQGRLDRAEPELLRALAEDPESALAHALLATCRSVRNDHDGAIAAARRAVAIEPGAAFCHHALAAVLNDAGREREAVPHAREALRLEPTAPAHHVLLATIAARRFRPREALDAVERALALDPGRADALALRASLVDTLGRTEEGESAIRSALRRAPESAEAHATAGLLSLVAGNRSTAESRLREALRLDPTDERARLWLLESLRSRHRTYHRILVFRSRALQRHPLLTFVVAIGAGVAWCALAYAALGRPAIRSWAVPVLLATGAVGFVTFVSDTLANGLVFLDASESHLLDGPHRVATALCWAGTLALVLFFAAAWVFEAPGLYPAAIVGGMIAFGADLPTGQPAGPRRRLSSALHGTVTVAGILTALSAGLFVARPTVGRFLLAVPPTVVFLVADVALVAASLWWDRRIMADVLDRTSSRSYDRPPRSDRSPEDP